MNTYGQSITSPDAASETIENDTACLVAEDVSVIRQSRTILQSASLKIPAGQVVALLGPNGAGKTTLLKVLAGEEPPDRGHTTINGLAMRTLTDSKLARMRAVLPQESPLSFPLRVIDVVLMGRLPYLQKMESGRDHQLALSMLRRVGVEHLSDRTYTYLSGGERQRVHLARVLTQLDLTGENQVPRYLLLDEPTSSLDIRHQHEIMRVARSIAAEGLGVFVILHDLNLAARYAHQIALINQGRIFTHGLPDDVLTTQNIAAVFDIQGTIVRTASDHPYFIPDLN
ncbi:MAG: heme ABC transporter ATP-binding protein [Leptospiraceae bacterium]|nr:heme ABC transporter ATP-binding protein [Leptospiraceae bacterium]